MQYAPTTTTTKEKMIYNPQIHHRRSIRLKGYDYSQAGAYFITICCHNREHRFGKIENGEMRLNEMGQIAYNEWLKTPQLRLNVSLDVFVVMPNHLHGIIVINGRGELNSPSPGSSDGNIRGEFDSPLRSPTNNIGAIVRGYKSAVTKQLNLINTGGPVWQRNYYENIIRNAESYQRIANYIVNNPTKWNEDKFHS